MKMAKREDKVIKIECKCGSDKFVIVNGNVRGYVKIIGEYMEHIINDKEIINVGLTICCNYHKVIDNLVYTETRKYSIFKNN